jgi:hypothetical protein
MNMTKTKRKPKIPVRSTRLVGRPITLTEAEIKHIATTPSGLEVAMDYHDLQMTMGEPMGFDCSGNQKRYDELKAARDRIREAWEGSRNH